MNTFNFPNVKWSFWIILIWLTLNFQYTRSQTFCTQPGTDRYAGEKDGYRYELWNQNGQGTACMTVDSGALFSGEWAGIQNYLARRGLGYDETQKHNEIGTFYATYDCDYNPSTASGNSYLSVYGWTVDPLKEYYIIEDWRNWIPSMAAGATRKGSITVDGSVYDIYVNTRVNQPSIIGNTTFQQYFSIRKNTRNKGSISISEHFKKWEELKLTMGNMYEVSFVVEGYQSSGNFKFNALDVFVDNSSGASQEGSKEPKFLQIVQTPDSGSIQIKLDDLVRNATIEIFDVTGKRVYFVKNANYSVQVSNLLSGVYFIRLQGNQLNYKTKFTVN